MSLSSFTAAEMGDVNTLSQKQNRFQEAKSNSSSSPVVDSSGNSPLHLSAQHGHVEATAFLLRYIDVNADSSGATPLHRASFSGAIHTMQLLISSPTLPCCNLLAVDESFGDLMTPLHKAASGGRYLAVQLLLHELRKRSILEEALHWKDASGLYPVEVAQKRDCNVVQETQGVARWNSVAGGPPDWSICVLLMQTAAASLSPTSYSSFPPLYPATTATCRIVSTSSSSSLLTLPPVPCHLMRKRETNWTSMARWCEGNCQPTYGQLNRQSQSWEEAFFRGLSQSVAMDAFERTVGLTSSLNEIQSLDIAEIEDQLPSMNRISPLTSFSEEKRSVIKPMMAETSTSSSINDNARTSQLTVSSTRQGRACDVCHELSFVLYPHHPNRTQRKPASLLVCKTCRGKTQSKHRSMLQITIQ